MLIMERIIASFMLAMLAATAVNAQISKGYYSIKNEGNGKYFNVLGRKTIGHAADNASTTGTIYLTNATEKKKKNQGEADGHW